MDKDPYAVLAVAPAATLEEIKKAYRKLAQEFHPDLFQNSSEADRNKANERMVEITEAFRVLGNLSERAVYDKKRAEKLATETANRLAKVSAQAAAAAVAQRASARPSTSKAAMDRDMARDSLNKMLAQLLSKGEGVEWKEKPPPTRDWMKLLKSDGLGTSYSLLMYQTRDATPSFFRQFLRNVDTYIQGQKSVFRDDFMIFLLAAERMPSPDEVMTMYNAFERTGKSGPLTKWHATLAIAFLDAQNMRLMCKPIPSDALKRTFQILLGKV